MVSSQLQRKWQICTHLSWLMNSAMLYWAGDTSDWLSFQNNNEPFRKLGCTPHHKHFLAISLAIETISCSVKLVERPAFCNAVKPGLMVESKAHRWRQIRQTSLYLWLLWFSVLCEVFQAWTLLHDSPCYGTNFWLAILELFAGLPYTM